MQFRSYSDLARVICASADRLGGDFDLVVGIPRSGMVPATMISLLLDKPLADLDGFLRGRVMARGRTRTPPGDGSEPVDPTSFRRVLIVDDSVNHGLSIEAARKKLARLDPALETTFLAVYAHGRSADLVDHCLELCSKPRIFEWNLFHAWLPGQACFDLDGVLCRDPTPEENDDGDRYRDYVATVPPLARPAYPIRRIVTSRLEKYRPETEAWLAANGIEYEHLHLLDLPSAEERRRQGAHAPFKASVYARDPEALLFVESDPGQALSIARRSGKPVLDYQNKRLADPTRLTVAHQVHQAHRLSQRVRAGLLRRLRRLRPGWLPFP